MGLKELKPRLQTMPSSRLAINNRHEGDRRITGNSLQKIRDKHFSEHPLCTVCLSNGMTTAAVHLDHITPLADGGKENKSNRQGLCYECHKAKTAQEATQRANDRAYSPYRALHTKQ